MTNILKTCFYKKKNLFEIFIFDFQRRSDFVVIP